MAYCLMQSYIPVGQCMRGALADRLKAGCAGESFAGVELGI